MAAPKPTAVSNPDRTAAKCNFVAQDQIWYVSVYFRLGSLKIKCLMA